MTGPDPGHAARSARNSLWLGVGFLLLLAGNALFVHREITRHRRVVLASHAAILAEVRAHREYVQRRDRTWGQFFRERTDEVVTDPTTSDDD